MKKYTFAIPILVAILVSTLPISGSYAATDGYNPGQAYQGKYTADALYYRNRNNPNWYRRLNGAYPKGVACRDALKHFMSDGKWKGNLNIDGSCGPVAEPCNWAVGNRLNYDAASKGAR